MQKGFTLIELLVVIAIIGLLSSVVLASLSTARLRARDAAIIAEVNQMVVIMELEYGASASYAAVQKGWSYNASTGSSYSCANPSSGPYTGSFATNAVQICTNVTNLLGSTGGYYTWNSVNLTNSFAVMAYLPGKNKAYCRGSSGAVSDTCAWGTWTCAGCYANP